VVVRTWRWAYLLKPILPSQPSTAAASAASAGITLAHLYPVVVIGYMGNNIYPARIGELLRAYVLRRNAGVPIASSLATVLIERIIDGIVMVTFVLIGLRAAPNVSAEVTRVVLVASVIFAAATAAFFVLALAPKTTERFADAIILRIVPKRFQPPLTGIVGRFAQGASSLRSPRDLILIVLSTVVVWLIETGKYWCVAHAFNMTLPFDGLMLINGVSNLFTVIPGAPGAVGTFDAGGILGATALGVPPSLAAAFVLTLHVALWLPVTALGAFFMLRQGLRWNDFQRAETAKA